MIADKPELVLSPTAMIGKVQLYKKIIAKLI